MTLTETRPAAHSNAAIFACDSGHLAYAWVAAMQIVALEPERLYDVVVATPDLAAVPERARQSPVRFRQIDVEAIPPFTHGNPRITLGTFYRHLLPAQLAGEYGALFYMDTDTWVRRPGLQGLFDRRPRDTALAAVPTFIYHPGLSGKPHPVSRRAAEIFEALGGEGLHWQSGVQMIDTAAHVQAQIAERIFAYVEGNRDLLARIRLGDQGALNGAIGEDAAILDPRWNWHHRTWMTPELMTRFDPFLLHFIGTGKPWQINADPIAGALNGEWFARLAEWDAGWQPEIRPNSDAWFRAHPKYGIPPLDWVHRLVHRRRAEREIATSRPIPAEGVAAMTRMIETADVR